MENYLICYGISRVSKRMPNLINISLNEGMRAKPLYIF